MGHHKVITEEQVPAAKVAFFDVHKDCPEQLLEIHEGPWSLVCWCRWCVDLRTYEVLGEEHPGDAPGTAKIYRLTRRSSS